MSSPMDVRDAVTGVGVDTPGAAGLAPPPRLDVALREDIRTLLRRRPLKAFLALELAAAAVLVLRRGEALLATIGVVWLGLVCVAFLAWWAGRHPGAVQTTDPVPAPAARARAALVGAVGLLIAGLGAWPVGGVLVGLAALGWVVAGRRGEEGIDGPGVRQLLRDPRPFVPLLLLVGLTRVLFGGLEPVGLIAGLASGVVQQVAYLVGLFPPLEAARGRTDLAAVLAALAFGAVHLPFDLDPNGGDWLAAAANAVIFQASVGMVACLAFVRHRAAVPIGLAHGLAIA
jgi:hypothetical protein